MELAPRIAESFSLGSARGSMRLAAEGWGGHNKVYRLETSAGSFAIKRYGRRPADVDGAAFGVELAALDGGYRWLGLSRAPTGAVGRRSTAPCSECHSWVDGAAKENEQATVADAAAMGRIVGRLHALAIPAPAVRPVRPPGPDRWREVIGAGKARDAIWATRLAEGLDLVVDVSGQPRPVDLGAGELVGSHRDLNAHNVLFSAGGLCLIDWDAAGPAWPRWERADFARRWAERGGGFYEDEAVVAFLRGYRDGGGEIDDEDPSVLAAAAPALVPWVLQNVELAIEMPGNATQHRLAGALVDALLSMPKRVAARQSILRRCLKHA